VALGAVITGLAVWILMQPSAPEQRPATKFVITPPLTTPLANIIENDLAISADGRHLAYVAVGEKGNQLYLRSLSDFVDKPIPGTEGINRGSPFFSPDGTSLAFFAGGQLRKVSLMGGSPITICDSQVVVGGSWGSEDTIVFAALSESGRLTLYRVSAAGGEREILATPDSDKGETGYWDPQFLTGGKALLLTIRRGPDNSQIAVLSLETGEQQILIEDGRQAKYINTGHLIYGQAATGNLMAVPFDLATLAVTGDPVPVLQGVRRHTSGSVDYALSDEGTLVYIPSQPDVQRLVWVDRKGTESLIIQEDVSFGSPRISPDGEEVALALSRSGEGQDLWIYDLEGESLRRLTFGHGSVETWSPDGKWIIFQGRDEEGLRAISRQLADGSGPIEHLTVPSPIAVLPGSLTPDGRVLIYGQDPGDILVLPMEGDSEPQPFITSPTSQCCPKFSPDGEWITYVSDELGHNHVYVSPYPNPDVKWLVSGEEGGEQPVWSPDGSELFYRSGDQMMVLSVQTEPTFNAGRPRVLFEESYLSSSISLGFQYYDISPDGQRFLMIKEAGAGQAQINVVLNWFEELNRLVPTP
ncbi:MAG: TolB family protein, partial [Candidatus Binatia bacterium]